MNSLSKRLFLSEMGGTNTREDKRYDQRREQMNEGVSTVG